MEVQNDIPEQICHEDGRRCLYDRHGVEGAPFDFLEDEPSKCRGRNHI